ncbi:xanthine dehydrogenase family protein molybdopterin-binding subunit [Antarcticimicrobium sediminis]|uniref:Xanthine dehydrogenase family protein molybdopterin-binding subunit n=1 Tax=Antarcticimicrobium sediminis TaxID=2546227 RepID=A0A4R5EYL6_9RHOB|nr:molybdopterin cofactor-binding domain-containing protein [Antarcticimicrobium sediminis]TDE40174.1 xanthine dehydrogenase family protein molybdopterin-binding subunit [Antarcticimicrobium sediminis]
MASIGKIARRSFLIGSAALVGGVAFGAYYVSRPAPNPLSAPKGGATLNPFVMIAPSGITLIAPKAEMGQGVHTTWAALIAEELDVDLDQVRVLHGPPAQAYYNSVILAEALPGKGYDRSDFAHALAEQIGKIGKVMDMQVTGGSTSMPDGFERMRATGASARETLKQVAATRLGVERASLKTERGAVIAPDGSRIPYADLAVDAAKLTPIEADLRPPAQWRLLGKTQPRIDMLGKVTGTAKYGIDTRLEGMKFAALRMNPHLGGRMTKFDDSAARAMPGVDRVVNLGNGLAVIASNTWLAMQAVDAIDIDWAPSPNPADTKAVFERITAAFDGAANSTLRDDGDVSVLPLGAQEVTAEYRVPYLAHATMEPMSATALFTGIKLEVWSGNQVPLLVRKACAEAVGLEPEAVELHTTYMGGGFGRRAELDFSVYAARVAFEIADTPVQLTWSREEDMRHDFYRPGAVARFRGGIKEGKLVLLDGQIAAQSATQQAMGRWLGLPAAGPDRGTVDGAFNQPYAIPNFRIRGYLADLDIPVGFWRSVGSSMNGFLFDCFIDEMAHVAKRDPLAFRLELAQGVHAPSAAVLEAVRDMSGWSEETPEGIGRGVGFCYSFGVPTATVIEVTDRDGQIEITRAWIAADVGTALDPGNLEAQLSGAMIYGLSAACFGEITFAEGAVEQENFPDYEALRIHTTPVTKVRILENQTQITGAGEPGTPPAMAALANALFDLTGTRARQLPLMHGFDLMT